MKIKLLITILITNVCFASSDTITVIHNIKGYSLNNGGYEQFSAIAFDDGMILKTGDSKNILELYPESIQINGNGNTMIPALQDSMIHARKYVDDKTIKLDLHGLNSKQDVLNKVDSYIRKNPNESTIQGYGWDYRLWSNDEFPDKNDLDSINKKKPIFLISEDGRVGWANSGTIISTRIYQHKKNPMEGIIFRDENGKQTGIYIDRAINPIRQKLPILNINELTNNSEQFISDLTSAGIGAFHEPLINFQTYNLYRSMTNRNNLPLRINAGLDYSDDKFKWALKFQPFHSDYYFYHVHELDYLFKDKINLSNISITEKTPKNNHALITSMIRNNLDKNWQPTIIVNNANELATAINLFKNIEKQKDYNLKTTRPKIEFHKNFQLLNLPSLRNQNMIFIMTPDMIINMLNFNKSLGNSPYQNLKEKGVMLVSGSNFPYSDTFNPFSGIDLLVNGHKNLSKKLTLPEALQTYTINAAYANRQETHLGNLQPDKWADFIIIDQDIFNIPTKKIKDVKVLQTWVGGKKVFDSEISK